MDETLMNGPTQQLTGLWFDGIRSRMHAATLTLDEHSVVTVWVDNAAQISCPLQELTFARRVSQTRRSIHLPQGSRFDTDDNDSVDHWQRQAQPRFRNRIHRFESTWPLMLLITGVIGLCSAWLVLEGLAAASSTIAENLPASIGQELGERSLLALDEQVFLPSRLHTKRQQQIHDYLAPALTAFPDTPMQIVFRDGGNIGPNAIALSDGTLILTDQLIALSHTPEELIAILAHEIGHVHGRHSLKSAVHSMLANTAALALSGQANLNSDLLLSTPLYMLDMSYSRRFEEEADNFGLSFLQQHGLSPEYFVNIMSRMARAETCIPEADEAPDDYDTYYNQTIACYRKLATLSREEINALPSPIAEAQAQSEFWGYMSSHPTTPERLKKFSAEK